MVRKAQETQPKHAKSTGSRAKKSAKPAEKIETPAIEAPKVQKSDDLEGHCGSQADEGEGHCGGLSALLARPALSDDMD